MLVTWLVEHSPHYVSMSSDQKIAYISDVGADILKPLFIVGSCVTAVTFLLTLTAERWLRYSGRIVPNETWHQVLLSAIALLGAIAGSAGLILLSIFDTKRHPTLHDKFLALFAAGILVSAIGTVLEFWRLGMHNRGTRALRISFWMKLAFFVVELGLAIAFGVTMQSSQGKLQNVAAILEWVLAIMFTPYLISFVFDLLPATRTDRGDMLEKGTPVQTRGGRRDRRRVDDTGRSDF